MLLLCSAFISIGLRRFASHETQDLTGDACLPRARKWTTAFNAEPCSCRIESCTALFKDVWVSGCVRCAPLTRDGPIVDIAVRYVCVARFDYTVAVGHTAYACGRTYRGAWHACSFGSFSTDHWSTSTGRIRKSVTGAAWKNARRERSEG